MKNLFSVLKATIVHTATKMMYDYLAADFNNPNIPNIWLTTLGVYNLK